MTAEDTVPTYQYACTEPGCGHAFEEFQSFSDDALTVCPRCEGRLRKVFNAVGVVFKGSGFYRTDSRAGGKSGEGAADGSTAKEGSGTKEGSGSKEGSGTKDNASGTSSSTSGGASSSSSAGSSSSSSAPAGAGAA